MSTHLTSRRVGGVLVATVLLAALVASVSHGESLASSWTSTTALPGPLGLTSCIINSYYLYAYCIAGETSTVYSTYTTQVAYGNLSAGGGISSWSTTTPYPSPVAGLSCLAYALSVICVGGILGHSPTGNVYSAPIVSSGLGAWTAASSYPIGIESQSCVTSTGFIYCVGGFDGIRDNATVYYAQLTKSGGVGTWKSTTSYPIKVSQLSCVADSGYVYCVGGATGGAGYADVYYAPLSIAGGVGAWVKTTSYPTSVFGHSCAASAGYVYCVGGYTNAAYTNSTYYAPLSATGVGAWTKASAYPTTIDQQSCVVYSGVLYCFGGFYNFAMSSSVYYNPISPPPATTTLTTTVTTTATATTTSSTTTTFTSISTVTASAPAQTVTATTTSFLTSVKTSAVTVTFQGLPVSTTTVTTALTSTATVTAAGPTQTATANAGSPLDYWPAAAGLAAGVALTLLFSRLRGRSRSAAGEAAQAPDEADENE